MMIKCNSEVRDRQESSTVRGLQQMAKQDLQHWYVHLLLRT